jgi:hypothetical protein
MARVRTSRPTIRRKSHFCNLGVYACSCDMLEFCANNVMIGDLRRDHTRLHGYTPESEKFEFLHVRTYVQFDLPV